MYNGLLIKESLNNEEILDFVEFIKVELWKTDNSPRYWTAITFTADNKNFLTMLSKSLKENITNPWYVDLKVDNMKYIVVANDIFSYQIGNDKEKQEVVDKCVSLGIKKEQIHWSE